MIIIMKEKDFLKKKKTLVVPKDYWVIDATDDAAGELSKFGRVKDLSGLKPPKALIRAVSIDSDKLDPDKIEKMEKRFFKSEEFLHSILGLVAAQIETDMNYFVCFKGKDFKAFGKRIYKKCRELFPTEKDVFFLIDEGEKMISKKISEETRRELKKSVEKIEKKLEKNSDDSEKKKKKDKDKDKKKKDKKKKKKNKYLYIE